MYDSPYLPFTTPTIFAKRAVLKAESAANSNHASIKIVITDEDIKSQIEEIKLKLVDETRNKKISEFKAQTKAELKQLYAEIKELEKFEPHYIFEHDKRFEQYQDEIIDSRMKEIEYERLEENYREAAEEYALRDRIYEETVAEKWGEERLDLYYVDKFIRFDKSLENNMRIDDLTLLDMTSSRIRDKAKENGEYYANFGHEEKLTAEPLSARQLRKRQRRFATIIEMRLGIIGGKFGAKRATKRGKDQRTEMNESNQRFLDTHQVKSKSGTIIKLNDIAMTRDKRLNEIYVIANGIQKLAEAQDMRWASVVCTLPANLHINPTFGKNTWNNSLPNESIQYLREKWSLMRSSCAKQNITLTGFWTVEAHSDGTPHINFLTYFKQDQVETVKSAFKAYFAHSEKAIKFRMGGDIKEGQKAASFASYALKYFTKTFNVNTDSKLYDVALSEEAWSSAFGIRRYGFFGIPPLSHWRRLRAATTAPADAQTAMLWRAARGNDAQKYLGLSGGIGIKNKDRQFESVSQTHKRSRIVTGVRNKSNGYEFVTKKLGEWTISKIAEVVSEITVNKAKVSTENTENTENSSKNGLHLNQVIQEGPNCDKTSGYKEHFRDYRPHFSDKKSLH